MRLTPDGGAKKEAVELDVNPQEFNEINNKNKLNLKNSTL